MRVRVLKPVRVYWNYAVQQLKEGEEVIGEYARHLLDNAGEGAVEVLDAEPATGPAPEDPLPPGDDDTADPDDADGPPVEGTADDLLTWVGGDPGRARLALDAEQAKDKPRTTVVKRLAALIE